MPNLKVFFKNLFDTQFISDDHIKEFSEVHLMRLTTNNPGGIYSTMITDTTTVYTGFFGAISDEDLKFSLQQGCTITMNDSFKSFIHTVQLKEGIIKGTWGKGSAQYEQFFPHGLTEYDKATQANAGLLMNRMVGAATANSADLPAGFVTLFTGLRTTYTDARTAQLTVMGEVSGLKTTSATTRGDLEVQLMKNVLIIASNNVGHPERVSAYFNQSIIRRHRPGVVPHVDVHEGPITLGQVININIDGFIDSPDSFSFVFENPGPVPYTVYAAVTPTATPGASATFNVNPGDSIAKTGPELLALIPLNSTTPLMNIINNGPGEGAYKITVTE
jgi:hypothetical protein